MNRTYDTLRVNNTKNHFKEFFIEGNIIEKTKNSVLMEKTRLFQKDTTNSSIPKPSSIMMHQEQEKPFVVVKKTDDGRDATFFNDIHQARIFHEKRIE